MRQAFFPPVNELEQEAARMASLPKTEEMSDWLWLRARGANGLRELERFPESIAAIDGLIKETEAALAAARTAKAAEAGDQLKSLEFLADYLGKLRLASLAGNPSSEPVDMLPARFASSFCKERAASLAAADKAACARLSAD